LAGIIQVSDVGRLKLGEVVLDLSKGVEHNLAVLRHRLVV
jgi:hypothetical protein